MVYKRSENEIKMISKSCQIVADTIDMLSEFVVPGALISDLDKKAENFIISQGADLHLKVIWVSLQRFAFQLKMQWFMVYLETLS